MQNLQEPSFFLNNKTGEEKGDVLGCIIPNCNISATYFLSHFFFFENEDIYRVLHSLEPNWVTNGFMIQLPM